MSSKSPRVKKPRSMGFRAQFYRLLSEGYFSSPRTSADIHDVLANKGFTFDTKDISSGLTEFTKKEYLKRERNDEGIYAYVKGSSDDYPRS